MPVKKIFLLPLRGAIFALLHRSGGTELRSLHHLCTGLFPISSSSEGTVS